MQNTTINFHTLGVRELLKDMPKLKFTHFPNEYRTVFETWRD